MSTRKWRLGAALYFAMQGASGVGWWAILVAFPPARELFWLRAPDGSFDGRGLMSFALPDAIGFVALSFVVAAAVARGSSGVWTLLCLHAGALGYATLACWNLALATRGETFLPALLMTPALAATAFWMLKLKPEAAR